MRIYLFLQQLQLHCPLIELFDSYILNKRPYLFHHLVKAVIQDRQFITSACLGPYFKISASGLALDYLSDPCRNAYHKHFLQTQFSRPASKNIFRS